MRCRLGDIVATNRNTYSPKDEWIYVNYLDTGSIVSNIITNVEYIDLKTNTLPSRAKRKVQVNSIIYSTVRPNQLHYGIVKTPYQNFLVSTGFVVIDVDNNKADADYVYYLLTQKATVAYLQNIAEQSVSAYPSIKPSDIEDIEIYLPDLTTQKQVSTLLRTFDEKMNLLSQINHNLEEQAKAIYKKMFMDNIPKNSPQSRLEDIAEITMGQSPHGSSFNEKEQGRIFFQGRAEFGQRFPKIRLYTTEPSRIAKANDILISVRAPVGDINIAYKDCCIGRGLASIRAKNGCQSFMLYTMLALKRKLAMFNAEGTVFGAINKQSLNTLPVFVPIEEKIRTFERIVAPTDEIILNNYTEICKLEKIRDALLPKLMSGEIDVSAVEIGR